jgi:hypothetical protein
MRLLVAAVAGVFGCLAQAQLITIPAGTRIPLKLTSPMGTDRTRAGDSVRAETALRVAVKGQTVIPQGTYVDGAIDKVRRHGQNAGFDVHFTRMIFANGYMVLLSSTADLTAGLVLPTLPGAPAALTAEMANALQASPTLNPPPPLPSHAALIVGIGVGTAVAMIVGFLILGHRASGGAGGLYVDAGARFDLVLTSPLTLDMSQLAAH